MPRERAAINEIFVLLSRKPHPTYGLPELPPLKQIFDEKEDPKTGRYVIGDLPELES
jgi:hypothetical protein